MDRGKLCVNQYRVTSSWSSVNTSQKHVIRYTYQNLVRRRISIGPFQELLTDPVLIIQLVLIASWAPAIQEGSVSPTKREEQLG